MRIAMRLFVGAGFFFAFLFAVYWLTSYEPAGSVLLGLGIPACMLIGGYLLLHLRRGGELAEDRPDAGPDESAGPVVAVPAPSLWPVGLAFGAGTLAAGLVIGPWLVATGAIILLVALVGVALNGRDYPAA
ncbi:MAG TPA: cytochrome c oxidase subunit 4 [Actinomycetota bacterium]|nr:cytochrome c oxidase subunit 4 [Actinomycetota bacterium]